MLVPRVSKPLKKFTVCTIRAQANLNIQIQGEIIADLENTVGAYRVIFRIPGY